MDEQTAWRLRYLQARVEAGNRADEVLALLRGAEDHEMAVQALAGLLQVDQQTADGVLDNWGANLSAQDRAEAGRALAEFRLEACRE